MAWLPVPESVDRWLERRGVDCYIDRHYEMNGRYASVSMPENTRVSLGMRKAVVSMAGLPTPPYRQWRAVCGEPGCCNPNHLKPRSRDWNVSRVAFRDKDQRDSIRRHLESLGYKEVPHVKRGRSARAVVGTFRVVERLGVVEWREPAR